ncbi:unnamed protein product [Rotaria sordida]|uniref:Ubiquitin-like domain-containing protein n=1 Tax=Rotaria sordida TaxID=392033 RepID=A0A818TZZ9_9BILA|nr:unnamed protein product [Rotaria sordida]
MLPKVRRFLNNTNNNSYTTNNKLTSSTDRLSNKSSSSSSADENNVYTETLLYIVHVDEIKLTADQEYDINDKQKSSQVMRRISKRTTASFNERQQNQEIQTSNVPISTPPSFSFSNPFRRLNNLLKTTDKSILSPSTPNLNVTPLCSSTAKKSSPFKRSRSQNQHSNELFPPPPPEFLNDNPIISTKKRPNIRASGPGLKDGFVNDHCHFDLNAPDAELQKLVIAIDGPSKADIQIEVIDTEIYRVYYKCQSSGKYHISLTYNGTHIDGSPYHLSLHAQSSQEQIVPPANIPMRAIIEPIEFYVNTSCIVNVRPETPCSVFQAYIQAPQGNINLPITVHKSTKSECYEIFFIPNTCGNHWLNVKFNHIPIIDNPCRLTVRPCSSMKSIVNSKEELFHAYTGELSQFFVSKSPYDSSSSTGNFSVGINGPSTVFLDANETEYGYEFHYKPIRSGKYLITAKNNGKHIQGSPFICHVYDKFKENRTISCDALVPIQSKLNHANSHIDLDNLRSSMTGDASQICVFGTGLYEAKKRRKATFKIDASQSGPGILLVGLYSPLGPCERLVVKRVMPHSPGFIYKVSYRVRTRGQYLLTILYGVNMEHVPGKIITMSNQSSRTPLPSARSSGEHIYTKLQVQFGGDVQDIVLKTEKEPTCGDLAKILQHIYRISIDHQLVYYRGQRLHHRHPSSYDRPLSKYGIFSGNLIKLVGKRGLL